MFILYSYPLLSPWKDANDMFVIREESQILDLIQIVLSENLSPILHSLQYRNVTLSR